MMEGKSGLWSPPYVDRMDKASGARSAHEPPSITSGILPYAAYIRTPSDWVSMRITRFGHGLSWPSFPPRIPIRAVRTTPQSSGYSGSSMADLHETDTAEGRDTLGLPAPPSSKDFKHRLEISSGETAVKLDYLGPMVVNRDGSLSRVANWEQMTEQERNNTLRVLGKRNKSRMEALKAQDTTSNDSTP